MTDSALHYRTVLTRWPVLGLLIAAGCAHEVGRENVYIDQSVKASTAYEKKGDLRSGAEELRVALALDPDNSDILGKLNRVVAMNYQEAERHYKTGISLRGSDPHRARREFIEALKLRIDYPEAVAALRELQLASAGSMIQGRVKKDAHIATNQAIIKPESFAEEEASREEYSLDTAISSYERGDYDTAVREFEKMKARYPGDPDILLYLDRSWYNAGVARFARKDYRQALEAFSRVSKGFERVNDYLAKCRAALGQSRR